MTGAHMPEGADAVVPVENTDFDSRDAGTHAPEVVAIQKAVKVGENVRRRGMDIQCWGCGPGGGQAAQTAGAGTACNAGYLLGHCVSPAAGGIAFLR